MTAPRMALEALLFSLPKEMLSHPQSMQPLCNVPPLRGWRNRIAVVQSLSQVRLFCNPRDCSSPGSSTHGILQARILERVAISYSKDPARVFLIGRWFLYH